MKQGMNQRSGKKTRAASLLLWLALGSLSFAGCSSPTPEQRAQWVTAKVGSRLGLSAGQWMKLDAVKKAMVEARSSHSAEREKSIEDLKQMILAEHLDAKRAKALLTEREKELDADFDAIFAKVAELHASLSSDQRRKAAELLDEASAYIK